MSPIWIAVWAMDGISVVACCVAVYYASQAAATVRRMRKRGLL